MSENLENDATLTDAQGQLLRRPFVEALLRRRGDALVITGLGNATYDAAAAGDRADNFYFWGAMGLPASAGLGLALAQPDRRVAVITGDGDMMMGIGSLATIANVAPANLGIVILDNQKFGETGQQNGLTAGPTDIAAMARGAGFGATGEIRSADEIDLAADLLFTQPGPALCVVKIATSEDPRMLPSLDGAYLARRFRETVVRE